MKGIEKIAIVLIVAGALQGPALWVILYFSPSLLQGDHLSHAQEAVGFSSAVATSLVAFVCACWLYLTAKRHGHSKWIWCLVGLLFKLPGVAVFYGFAILERLDGDRNANKPLQDSVVPPHRER